MARLHYAAIGSLDGYVADREGDFGWAEPAEDVHAWVNDLQRGVGTYLLGRRMYDVLVAWETLETTGEPEVIREFAELWHGADKVVYSRTLQETSSTRTNLERTFDAASVQRMKDTAERDLTIGGPELAGQALSAGLVDECHLFLVPAVVGGGTRIFSDGLRLDLELLEERRSGNGTAYLRYRVSR